MDRPLPTDPPDEPVNRIKEFFESPNPIAFPEDAAHPAQVSDYVPTAFTPEEFRRELQELTLTYQKDVTDTDVVWRITQIYWRLGEWESALAYLEWLHQLKPMNLRVSRMIRLIRSQLDGERPKG